MEIIFICNEVRKLTSYVEKREKCNMVVLSGCINSEMEFDHVSLKGVRFYIIKVDIKRLSNTVDTIPVMVSELQMNPTKDYTGKKVQISVFFRSCRIENFDNGKRHLMLSVFADSIDFMEGETGKNDIYLDGYLCSDPVYRETPKGKIITDAVLAVNSVDRSRSDYIPVVFWGSNAKNVAFQEKGAHIRVSGRAQSRIYTKCDKFGKTTNHTAYEVSVFSSEVIETADEIRNAKIKKLIK